MKISKPPKSKIYEIITPNSKHLPTIGEGSLIPNMGRGGIPLKEENVQEIPVVIKNPSLKREEFRKEKTKGLSDLI